LLSPSTKEKLELHAFTQMQPTATGYRKILNHKNQVPSDLATSYFRTASLQNENIKTPKYRTDAVNLFLRKTSDQNSYLQPTEKAIK
jgi:hypothetical protein